MTKVRLPDNCGNSPKSQKIADFYTALFALKTDVIVQEIADDFEYVIYGDNTYAGESGVRELIALLEQSQIEAVDIEVVISHGKYVASTGVAQRKDGTRMAFSEMCTFEGHSKTAKIAKIESYTIPL